MVCLLSVGPIGSNGHIMRCGTMAHANHSGLHLKYVSQTYICYYINLNILTELLNCYRPLVLSFSNVNSFIVIII